MVQISRSQKIYTFSLLGIVALWLALKLAIPIYEYAHGRDALSVLLREIATVLGFAMVGIGLVYVILQRIGVLPTVAPPATAPVNAGMRRLRNLAIWIVIALLLVFLFNLFQSGKSHALDSPEAKLALQFFPFVLVAVIWIFFALQMYARKKKDLNG